MGDGVRESSSHLQLVAGWLIGVGGYCLGWVGGMSKDHAVCVCKEGCGVGCMGV